jgi:hypothetical protein
LVFEKILFLTCYLDPDPHGFAFKAVPGILILIRIRFPDPHKVNADPKHWL